MADPAPDVQPSRTTRRRARKRAGRRRLYVLVGIAVLVLGGGSVAAVLLLGADGSPGPARSSTGAAAGSGARLADPDLAAGFTSAAGAEVAAVTSYDYRHLDDALAAGLAVTTGNYRRAYQQALTGSLAAQARAKHVVKQFQVVATGIGTTSADGRTAKVLVFGEQLVTDSATKGAPAGQAVTLCVTMLRSGQQYKISDLVQDANAGVPPGTADLTAAVEAARIEVGNLLSYRRAQFPADLERALSGAIDPLQAQVRAQAAAARTSLLKGKYDLSGVVIAVAVQSASGSTARILVAARSDRLDSAGATIASTPMRYLVTATRTQGRWLVSRADAIT